MCPDEKRRCADSTTTHDEVIARFEDIECLDASLSSDPCRNLNAWPFRRETKRQSREALFGVNTVASDLLASTHPSPVRRSTLEMPVN